jgi:hypothetical protein
VLDGILGYAAHAEGGNTVAEANYSHAGGLGTKATAEAQTVVGKNNEVDNNALFIVGNGATSFSDKKELITGTSSNAFVVDKDGNAFVKNILTVGSLYIGNYKIVIEEWTLQLADGNTITKKILVADSL